MTELNIERIGKMKSDFNALDKVLQESYKKKDIFEFPNMNSSKASGKIL